MAHSSKQRKEAFRARQEALGLKRVELYLTEQEKTFLKDALKNFRKSYTNSQTPSKQ
jgi:hypothetical protein